MNTLKIIEGQEEKLKKEMAYDFNFSTQTTIENKVLNWHKQSIIQILESEIDRKRGMKKEYTESFHVDEVEKNQAVKYKNHGEVGFNRCLKEDIAHLQGLLDSLK